MSAGQDEGADGERREGRLIGIEPRKPLMVEISRHRRIVIKKKSRPIIFGCRDEHKSSCVQSSGVERINFEDDVYRQSFGQTVVEFRSIGLQKGRTG
jgi:hypothetical protein